MKGWPLSYKAGQQFLTEFVSSFDDSLENSLPTRVPLQPLQTSDPAIVSPSILLRAANRRDPVPPQFQLIDHDGPLGIWAAELNDPYPELFLESVVPPEPKKVRMGRECSEEDRFGTRGEDELQVLSKSYVPPATEANTKWAISNFNDWKEWRNKQNPESCS